MFKMSTGQKKRARRGGQHVGKVRYGHLETAQAACERMAQKGADGLTPYFCQVCNGYHIGHEPKVFTFEITSTHEIPAMLKTIRQTLNKMTRKRR